MRLRPGITFHEGSIMSAQDVKFTFDRLTEEGAKEGETSPGKSQVGPLTDTEIVDVLVVRFELSARRRVFLAYPPFDQVVGSLGRAGRPARRIRRVRSLTGTVRPAGAIEPAIGGPRR